MPNDAKLGLVVGVGLVVAVAVIFTRPSTPASAGPTAAVVRTIEPTTSANKVGQAKMAANPKAGPGTPPRPYRPEYEFVSDVQHGNRR